jgi:DNA-binding MarR family transcriptional regulator
MDFDPAHPLLAACKALGAAFDQRDAEIASRLGISRNELRLLNLLEEGPRSQVDIAARLVVSRAAVTAMVDSLTRHELVERTSSDRDRRIKLVSLTPRVWRLLADHYGPGGRRVLAAANGLNADELDAMIGLLHRITDAIVPQEASTATS